MKFFSNFVKELKIASRGFYFYIEIFVALLIVAILLFVVPDDFDSTKSEYIYLDMTTEASDLYLEGVLDKTVDGKSEDVKVKIDKVEKDAVLYTLEDSEIYVLDSREDVVYMGEKEREIAVVINMDEDYAFNYEYYIQGYESDKYKDLLKISHVESIDIVEDKMDNQDVRALYTTSNNLSDKENILPNIMVLNGSLMGLFIIAAYIFLDKQEGVIKAYALTPSPVWQYLLSKISVILVTSIVSSLIVLVPIMKFRPDYLLLMVLLVATAFFSSSLGLLIASCYKNIIQAFAGLYTVMMIMIIPSIAYFIPSWNPSWIKIIPTYHMLEGFKSIILGNGDWIYIFSISIGFLLVGMILFGISNWRYKNTLIE